MEINRLRNLLDNSKGKIVRQELSCSTKLKRAENRMKLLKINLKEVKEDLLNHKSRKRNKKQNDKHVVALRTSLASSARKCSKEIDRLNKSLRQCERGL